MNVIHTTRGTGKTTFLLKMASKNNGVYVGKNQSSLQYAKMICKQENISVPVMSTIRQAKEGRLQGFSDKIYVDDIGLLLQDLLKVQPSAIAI